jgi:hypothetical protein
VGRRGPCAGAEDADANATGGQASR